MNVDRTSDLPKLHPHVVMRAAWGVDASEVDAGGGDNNVTNQQSGCTPETPKKFTAARLAVARMAARSALGTSDIPKTS